MSSEHEVERHLFVVLGGTGDLMTRKLLPALSKLREQGLVDKRSLVLGTARNATLDDQSYQGLMREALIDAKCPTDEDWLANNFFYFSMGRGEPENYERLATKIKELEENHNLSGNRVFYLALPPQAFPGIITGLGQSGLASSSGWTRLVIEKPFGRNHASAVELNHIVHSFFEEDQIYRIDHYLGKETVQNLLVFRFANMLFESVWQRDRIDNVQITVAEQLGVEDRAGYYDRSGALRDMVQNHATQLMTLIAMDAPADLDAHMIRDEKLRVLRSMYPVQVENAIFGQYAEGEINETAVNGYLSEPDIGSDSTTETFIALKASIDNWRWQGVPFYIRSGKRLPIKRTEIAVVFREPPVCLFQSSGLCNVLPNVLRIVLQPDEGFSLQFQVKAPHGPVHLRTHALDFSYADAFESLPDAYQTLMRDFLRGDPTLFVRGDEVEAAWQLYEPLLDNKSQPLSYAAGTWGPEEANKLLFRDGRRWYNAE